jgi:hypothetical protein
MTGFKQHTLFVVIIQDGCNYLMGNCDWFQNVRKLLLLQWEYSFTEGRRRRHSSHNRFRDSVIIAHLERLIIIYYNLTVADLRTKDVHITSNLWYFGRNWTMFIDFPVEENEKYYKTYARMDGIETDIQTSGTRLQYYDHYTMKMSSIRNTDASVFRSKKCLPRRRLGCGLRPSHEWR